MLEDRLGRTERMLARTPHPLGPRSLPAAHAQTYAVKWPPLVELLGRSLLAALVHKVSQGDNQLQC